MLALGFCFSALPICKRLLKSDEEREEFILRHLEFFNAHPYFASWCLGATAKLEEEALRKRHVDYQSISKFKDRIGSATGAIGDILFWNLIKPISAGIAVIIALLGLVLAVPIFLVLFNIPHFIFRVSGVFRGYKQGFDIISEISMRRYSRLLTWLSRYGVIITGMLFSVSAIWVLKGTTTPLAVSGSNSGFVAFILCIPLTVFLIKLKASVPMILLAAVCLSIIIGLF